MPTSTSLYSSTKINGLTTSFVDWTPLNTLCAKHRLPTTTRDNSPYHGSVEEIIRRLLLEYLLWAKSERDLVELGAAAARFEAAKLACLSLAATGSTEQQPQTPAIGGEEVYPDNKTGLMWTIKDNGEDITWHEADQYCRTLNLAGLSGWELPRIDELEKLYDPQSSSTYKIRNPFRLTSWVWSSNMDGSGSAWSFGFHGGRRAHEPMVFGDSNRALCVRHSRK